MRILRLFFYLALYCAFCVSRIWAGVVGNQNEWVGAPGGAWEVGSNWSLEHVPSVGEIVVIGSGDDVALNSSIVVEKLHLQGGTISGAHTLTFTAEFKWWSGTLKGDLNGVIPSGSLIQLLQDPLIPGNRELDSATIHVSGSFLASAGMHIIGGGSLTIEPGGTAEVASGSTWTSDTGQGSVFTTSGNATFQSGDPISFDVPLAITGGTVEWAPNLAFHDVQFSAGTLTGSASVTSGHLFRWTGGEFSGAFVLSIDPGGVLEIDQGVSKILNEGFTILTLPDVAPAPDPGLIRWLKDDVFGGNGTKIQNQGELLVTGSGSLKPLGNPTPFPVLENSGEFKLDGDFDNLVQWALTNSGTVLANIGSISFTSGGGLAANTSFGGNGEVRLETGVYQFAGAFQSTSLVLNGATIQGTPELSGHMRWASGDLSGPAPSSTGDILTIKPGALLELVSNGTRIIGNGFRLKILAGNVEVPTPGAFKWTGTGSLSNVENGIVENRGLIEISNHAFLHASGNEGLIENYGTFRKLAEPTGNATIQWRFKNAGLLDSHSDSLRLERGGQFLDGTIAQGIGRVRLLDSSLGYDLSGTIQSENLTFEGLVRANEVATLVGTAYWAAGGFSDVGTLAVSNNSQLILETVDNKSIANGFKLQTTVGSPGGIIRWESGALLMDRTTEFVNGGLFEISVDQTLQDWLRVGDGSLPIATFKNSGTIRKLETTGTTTIQVTLEHTGVLDVQSGTLLLLRGKLQNGGSGTGPGIVKIDSPGLELSGSMDFTNLQFDGVQTLNGDATITGLVRWTGGEITGNGRLIVAPGGTLRLETTANKLLSNQAKIQTIATPEALGVIDWVAGDWYVDRTTEIVNEGKILVRSDNQMIDWLRVGDGSLPLGLLRNIGRIEKLQGGGATTIQVALEHTGVLDVQSGTLLLLRGKLQNGGSGTGPGIVKIDSPGLELSGSMHFTNLQFDGVQTLNGDATITGLVRWTGGEITGNGRLIIAPGGTLRLETTSNKFLSNPAKISTTTTIEGAGVIEWLAGAWYVDRTTEIANAGEMLLKSDNQMIDWLRVGDGSLPRSLLTNSGAIRKTGGTGNSSLGANLAHTGILTTETGRLILESNGTISGLMLAETNTVIEFSSDVGIPLNLMNGSRIEGEGTTFFNGSVSIGENQVSRIASGAIVVMIGDLGGPGQLTVEGGGKLDWRSGDIGFGITLRNEGEMLLSTGSSKTLSSGGLLINLGTLTWRGGTLFMDRTTRLENQGLFLIESDLQVIDWLRTGDGSLPMATIQNTGTIRKLGTTGTTTINVQFENPAAMDVQSGILALTRGKLLNGASSTGNGVVRIDTPGMEISGSLDLSNTQFDGTLTLNGDVNLEGVVRWTSGEINGNGRLIIIPGSILRLETAANKMLANQARIATLKTEDGVGIIDWVSGHWYLDRTTQIDNAGEIQIRSDHTMVDWLRTGDGSLPRSILNSTGRILKLDGTQSSKLGAILNHSGVLEAQKGTLETEANGTYSGRLVTAAGATILLSSDVGVPITLLNGAVIEGDGVTVLDGLLAIPETQNVIVADSARVDFAGNLAGPGTLLVQGPNGKFDWSSGQTTLGGTLRIDGKLEFVTTANKFFGDNWTIQNNGTTRWINGHLFFDRTTKFLNAGLFRIESDHTVLDWLRTGNSALPRSFIDNSGIFEKVGGNASTLIHAEIRSSGTIQASMGILTFEANGHTSGAIASNGDGVVLLSSDVGIPIELRLGTVFQGTGTNRWAGDVLIPAGTTVPIETGARLELTDRVDSTGKLLVQNGAVVNWKSGQIVGTGEFLIEGQVSLTTTADKAIGGGGLFKNQGSVLWENGHFYVDKGTTVQNLAQFDVACDRHVVDWGLTPNTPRGLFENRGTLTKLSATGETVINTTFINSGAIQVNQGLVRLVQGGAFLPDSTQGGSGSVLLSSGSFDLSGEIDASNLVFAGATITAEDNASLVGHVRWTSGQLVGPGEIRILPTSVFELSGTSDKFLSSGMVLKTLNDLVSPGKLLWSGGHFYLDRGTTILNEGQFQIQVDRTIVDWSLHPSEPISRIVNTGRIEKSATSGETPVQSFLIQDGVVDVVQGTLSLTKGGTSQSDYHISAGATLEFAGSGINHTLAADTQFTGLGLISANATSLIVDTKQVVRVGSGLTFEILGGKIDVQGTLKLEDATQTLWKAGEVGGPGIWLFDPGSIIKADTSSSKFLSDGITLKLSSNNTNSASFSWLNGHLFIDRGTTLENDGFFEIKTPHQMVDWTKHSTNSVASFVNRGLVKKFESTNQSEIAVSVQHLGNIEVLTGTLRFAGGGEFGAPVQIADGAVAQFSGTRNYNWLNGLDFMGLGIAKIDATSMLIPNGNDIEVTAGSKLEINGAQLDIMGVLNMRGGSTATWSSGVMGGAGEWRFDPESLLIISSTANKFLSDTLKVRLLRNENNFATAQWNSGHIFMDRGTSLENDGMFEIRTAHVMLDWSNHASSPISIFTNNGTIRQSLASGQATIGVTLINNGVIENTAGVLSLEGGSNSVGPIVTSPQSITSFAGTRTHVWSSGNAFTGLGVVRVVTGTIQIPASQVILVSRDSRIEMSGGTMEVIGSLRLSTGATFVWTGGTISGPQEGVAGAVQIEAGSIFEVSSTQNKFLRDGISVLNFGDIQWLSGHMYLDHGAKIVNSGRFEIQSDHVLANWRSRTSSLPIGVVENQGELVKLGGTGTTTIQGSLTHLAGNVRAETGRLLLDLGESSGLAGGSNGEFRVLNGAIIEFSHSGAFELRAGTSFNGTGGFVHSGGTLQLTEGTVVPLVEPSHFVLGGAGVLQGDGVFEIQSGATFDWQQSIIENLNALHIKLGGRLEFTGSGNKFLKGDSRIVNDGEIIWSDGHIFSDRSSFWQNNARFEAQADGRLLIDWNSGLFPAGQGAVFLNEGHFVVSENVGLIRLQIDFRHQGTFQIQSGELSLEADGLIDRPMIVGSGSALRFAGGGTFMISTGAAFQGPGVVDIQNSILAVPSGHELSIDSPTQVRVTANSTSLGVKVDGTLNVAGGSKLSLIQGSIFGTGEVLIHPNGILELAGTSWSFLGDRLKLKNLGSIEWITGQFYVDRGVQITNEGSLEIAASAAHREIVDFNQSGRPTSDIGVLNNLGNIGFASGSNPIAIRIEFDQGGRLQAGSSVTLTGGGSTSEGSVFSGAGLIEISAGTYQMDGAFNVENVRLSGTAVLTGHGVLTSGRLVWEGGTMGGVGSLTIAPGATLQISGSTQKQIDAGFQFMTQFFSHPEKGPLRGVIDWSGTGQVVAGSGVIVNNAGLWKVSGVLPVGAGRIWFLSSGASPTIFNNLATGQFLLETGSQRTEMASVFRNSGVVRLLSSTEFNSGYGNSGTFEQIAGLLMLEGGHLRSAPGIAIMAGEVQGQGTLSGSTSLGGTIRTTFSDLGSGIQINGALQVARDAVFAPTIRVQTTSDEPPVSSLSIAPLSSTSAATITGGTILLDLGQQSLAPGTSYGVAILTASSRSGEFNGLNVSGEWGASQPGIKYLLNGVAVTSEPKPFLSIQESLDVLQNAGAIQVPFTVSDTADSFAQLTYRVSLSDAAKGTIPEFPIIQSAPDSDSGFVVFTPNENATGDVRLNLTVINRNGLSTSKVVLVAIHVPNSTPLAHVDFTQTVMDQPVTILGSSVLENDFPDSQFGFVGRYYGDWDANGPVAPFLFERMDSSLEFESSGSSDGGNWDARAVANGKFAVRWEGSIQPSFNETYQLETITSHPVRVWLDGELIIDNWTQPIRTGAQTSSPLSLRSNLKYHLRVDYYQEVCCGTSFRLKWASQSQASEVVPAARVLHGLANSNQSLRLESVSDTSLKGGLVVLRNEVASGRLGRSNLGAGTVTIQYSPPTGFSGLDEFTYTISDEGHPFGELSALGRIVVRVDNVNQPPSIAEVSEQQVAQDGSLFVPLTVTDDGFGDTGFELSFDSSNELLLPDSSIIVEQTPQSSGIRITPLAGRSGTTVIKVMATDRGGLTAERSFLLTVGRVNHTPVAQAQNLNVTEDTEKQITLVAEDEDADSLSFIIVVPPVKGDLIAGVDSAHFTYVPNPNEFGPDSFTFKANDGSVDSSPAVISIQIAPVNDPPLASAAILEVTQEGPSPLLLRATDQEVSILSYRRIGEGPNHGVITGNPPDLFYTPNPGFAGNDSFQFIANDGALDSNVGEVSIIVHPFNWRPRVENASTSTLEDSPVRVELNGFDPDADLLSYSIVTSPSHGSLAGEGRILTYTPNLHFAGLDFFEFQISDGNLVSPKAVFQIEVSPVNDPPIVVSKTLVIEREGPFPFELEALDADLQALTVRKHGDGPRHGVVTGEFPNFSYTPNSGFAGSDSFQFIANDGVTDSNVAEISVTVEPFNWKPQVENLDASTLEDTPLSLQLAAVDPNEDPITFTIRKSPVHGILSGTAPQLTYTPSPNFVGQDSFEFSVNDGELTSNVASVNIAVNSVNDAPFAQALNISVPSDGFVDFQLGGGDLENSNLSFVILQNGPSSGAVSGTAPNLRYTPRVGFVGNDSFEYTVSDGELVSTPATVRLEVFQSNQPPVAFDAVYQLAEDGSVNFSLIASDPNGNAVSYSIVSLPSRGIIQGVPPNLTYTPASSFSGLDFLSFRVSDGQFSSQVATVRFEVSSINDPPVALAQNILLQEDSAVPITLVGTDEESEQLLFRLESAPLNGVLTGVAPNLIYTPTRNFTGSDRFTYSVQDGTSSSGIAIVDLQVTSQQDAPSAEPDVATTLENIPIIIHVLANDLDVDGDRFTIESVSKPSAGETQRTDDFLSIRFVPNRGFSGSDTFEYTILDEQGGRSTARVEIRVTSVNDSPVALEDTGEMLEDSQLVMDVLSNDVDADGDVLRIVAVSSAFNGITRVAEDGRTIIYRPSPDFNGQDQFDYTVSDSSGASAKANVFVSVRSANDPPLARNDTVATQEDQSILVLAIANDLDADGDRLVIISTEPPANGRTEIVSDGQGIRYIPAPNFSGSDRFQYTVRDQGGAESVAVVSIIVEPINDAPLVAIRSVSTPEDTALVIATLNGITDPEGDAVTIKSVSGAAHGQVTLQSVSSTIVYTPDRNFNGNDLIQYVVVDSNGAESSGSIEVQVLPLNDPPTAVNDLVSSQEDLSLSVEPITNDSDTDGDSLVVVRVEQGRFGSTAIRADRRTIDYSPSRDFQGEDSFNYVVSDGKGGESVALISVRIAGSNDAPVTGSDILRVEEDSSGIVNVLENDLDVDGDELQIVAVSDPANGTVSLSVDRKTIRYTPRSNFTGSDVFTYLITDGNGSDVEGRVSVEVNPVNDQPQPLADNAQTREDEAVEISVIANDLDVDNDLLTVISLTNPQNGRAIIAQGSRSITYTPNANFSGTDTFLYRVQDGKGGNAEARITVAVETVNDNPQAVADSISGNEDLVLPVNVLLNDQDVDGDQLRVVGVTQGTHGRVSIANEGTGVVYQPDANFSGDDAFSYRVSDGKGGEGQASVKVTITPENDQPIAIADNIVTAEDTPVVVSPLANDSDAESQILRLVSATAPASGAVVLDAQSNQIRYTPSSNFVGFDEFTYVVADEVGAQSIGRVVVEVTDVNDLPIVIAPDVITSVENQSVEFEVQLSDPDHPVSSISLRVETDNSALIDPAKAMIEGDGVLRKIRVVSNPSAFGNATIRIVARDPAGGSTIGLVALTVQPGNTAPFFGIVEPIVIDENSALPASALIVLDKEDSLDVLKIRLVSSSNPVLIPIANLQVTKRGDRIVLEGGPVRGQAGFAEIILEALDTSGASAQGTVAITVRPLVNSNPIFVSVPGNQNVAAGRILGPLPVVISDAETPGNNLTLAVESTNPNVVGVDEIILGGSGGGRTLTITPRADRAGTARINLLLSDSDGGNARASFDVAVTPVNGLPSIELLTGVDQSALVPKLSLVQGEKRKIIFNAKDRESSIAQLQVGVKQSVEPQTLLMPEPIVVTQAGDNFSFEVEARVVVGTGFLDISATDAQGGVTTVRVVVNVSVRDLAPVISGARDLAVLAGTVSPALEIRVVDDLTSMERIGVSIETLTPELIPLNAVQLRQQSPGNYSLIISPTSGTSGLGAIRVLATDETGKVGTAIVGVRVTLPNEPPTLLVKPVVETAEDTPISIIATLDDDATSLEALVLRVEPRSGSVVQTLEISNVPGRPNQRAVRVVPDLNFHGDVGLELTVTDSAGLTRSSVVRLMVLPVNDLPQLGPIQNQITIEDGLIGPVELSVSDVETPLNLLRFSASSSNPDLFANPLIRIDTSSGKTLLRMQPASDATGTAVVRLSVEDQNGAFSTREFTVSVTPIDDPSLAVVSREVVIDEDTVADLRVLLIDPDNDRFRSEFSGVEFFNLSASSSNPNLVANTAESMPITGVGESRNLKLMPRPGASGTGKIRLRLQDRAGGESFTDIDLIVRAINDQPRFGNVEPLLLIADGVAKNLQFSVLDEDDLLQAANFAIEIKESVFIPPANSGFVPSGDSKPVVLLGNLLKLANGLWGLPVSAGPNPGSLRVSISVSDKAGGSDVIEVPVIIRLGNRPPEVTGFPPIISVNSGENVDIDFTLADAETNPDNLLVSVQFSSPTRLLPQSAIEILGTGPRRTLRLRPPPSNGGEVPIELVVKDLDPENGNPNEIRLKSTVNIGGANLAPILDLGNAGPIVVRVVSSSPIQVFSQTITVSDDFSNPSEITIDVKSSDPLVIDPVGSVLMSGSGSSRVLQFTSVASKTSTIELTVVATDSLGASSSKLFTVNFVTEAKVPEILPIPDVIISGTPSSREIQVITEPKEPVTFTAIGLNEELFPAGSITVDSQGDPGAARIGLNPTAALSGSSIVLVTARNAEGLVGETRFNVTVSAPNQPPTLDPVLSPIRMLEDSADLVVLLTGISGGKNETTQRVAMEARELGDTKLLQTLTLTYQGGSQGFLTLKPIADRSGSTQVLLKVSDLGDPSLSIEQIIPIQIDPVNDAPKLSVVELTPASGSSTGVAFIQIFDEETFSEVTPSSRIKVISLTPQLVSNDSLISGFEPGANNLLLVGFKGNSGVFGLAKLEVQVTDSGGLRSRLEVGVNVRRSPQIILGSSSTIRLGVNQVSERIPITLIPGDGVPGGLMLSAGASPGRLFPFGNIEITGSGLQRFIQITPLQNASGIETLNIHVADEFSVRGFASLKVEVAVLPPKVELNPLQYTIRKGAAGSTLNLRPTVPLGRIGPGVLAWNVDWRLGGNLVSRRRAISEADLAFRIPISVQGTQTYRLDVSNTSGSTNLLVNVTVVDTPLITSPPSSQQVNEGTDVFLNVEARGSGLKYQWSRGGEPIPGEIRPILVLPRIQANQGGAYTVEVYVDATEASGRTVRLGSTSTPAIVEVITSTLTMSDEMFDAPDMPQEGKTTTAAGLMSIVGGGRASNLDATFNTLANEQTHANARGSSMWMKWRAERDGIMRLDTMGSPIDTVIGVYRLSQPGVVTYSAMVEIVSNDDANREGAGSASEVTFNTRKDELYYFVVAGVRPEVKGGFSLNWDFLETILPAPEIIEAPATIRLSSFGQEVFFSVIARNARDYQWTFTERDSNGLIVKRVLPSTGPELVIRNVAFENIGTYTVTVSNPAGNSSASAELVLTDQNVIPGNKLGVQSTFTSSGSGQQLTSRLTVGLRRESSGVASGFRGTQVFNTVGATRELGEPPICEISGGASEWTSYVAPSTGTLRISTAGSNFDTLVGVFTGPVDQGFEGLTLVGCDDNGGSDGKTSLLSVSVVAGTTYFIAVDGANGTSGTANLQYELVRENIAITLPPPALQSGLISLTVPGVLGAKYELQTSVNLVAWKTILVTNATSPTIQFKDSNFGSVPVLFYRIVKP